MILLDLAWNNLQKRNTLLMGVNVCWHIHYWLTVLCLWNINLALVEIDVMSNCLNPISIS